MDQRGKRGFILSVDEAGKQVRIGFGIDSIRVLDRMDEPNDRVELRHCLLPGYRSELRFAQ